MSLMARIEVFGQPAPQGSKSAFVRGGRAIVTEGGSKVGRESHAAWRQAVATAARDWQQEHRVAVFDEPLLVRIEFRLVRPKSVPKARVRPTVKPDLDKLTRSVLDALTGVVIVDDSRVVELHVSKHYAVDEPPGAVIQLGSVAA